MNTGTKIALAASGGYLLGRTKKAKLALAFGLFLAGRKLPKSPLELVQQGAGALSKNPQVAELTEQVKGSLFDAGKAAAGRSAERWLSSVGDRLREGIPTPDVSGKQADQDEEADEDEGQEPDQETDQEDTESEDFDQDADEATDEDSADEDGTDEDSTEDSEEDDSQDTDEDSSQSQNDNSSKRSGQRRSRSSGSSRPAKKSGSRSRAAKGA